MAHLYGLAGMPKEYGCMRRWCCLPFAAGDDPSPLIEPPGCLFAHLNNNIDHFCIAFFSHFSQCSSMIAWALGQVAVQISSTAVKLLLSVFSALGSLSAANSWSVAEPRRVSGVKYSCCVAMHVSHMIALELSADNVYLPTAAHSKV